VAFGTSLNSEHSIRSDPVLEVLFCRSVDPIHHQPKRDLRLESAISACSRPLQDRKQKLEEALGLECKMARAPDVLRFTGFSNVAPTWFEVWDCLSPD
jgi:hypothetical protein